MKTLFIALIVALGLMAHEPASAQTVASCPTATPGSTWNPTTQWLKCSDLTFIAEPIPATALINDMRCNHVSDTCVFTWMLPAKVLPTDQTWVETTAKPKGRWVSASTLTFASAQPNTAQSNCTTLVYKGAPLTIVPAGLDIPMPPLVGVIVLPAPIGLGNPGTPQTVTPTSFDFTSENPEFIYPAPESLNDIPDTMYQQVLATYSGGSL